MIPTKQDRLYVLAPVPGGRFDLSDDEPRIGPFGIDWLFNADLHTCSPDGSLRRALHIVCIPLDDTDECTS